MASRGGLLFFGGLGGGGGGHPRSTNYREGVCTF